jgi:uncharacterized protein (DUF697 family)
MGYDTPSSETNVSAEAPTGLPGTETIDSERDELASRLVRRLSLWSGAAGLIPLPLVDVTAVGGVQLYMLRALAKIYGVPFSENRGKSILASWFGSLIPASAATTTFSLTKGVPGLGTVIGALTMPVVSAGATWVIGQVFIQHFTAGGTLLDFDPAKYREFVRMHREKSGSR